MTIENLYALQGNHERYLTNGMPVPRPVYISDGELHHHQWVMDNLNVNEKEWINKLPYQMNLNEQGQQITFLHSLLMENKYDFSQPKELTVNCLDEYFNEIEANIICYGHIHSQRIVKGKKHYINPGSLGCNNLSTAHFYMLNINKNGLSIEKMETEYNGKLLLKELKKRKVPDREMISMLFYGKQ